MIVRMWRGQAKAENADAYEHFVTTKVFAELPAIAGHRGAYLLKRPTANGEVEFIAVTLWESLASIRGFAGDDHRSRRGRARGTRRSFQLRRFRAPFRAGARRALRLIAHKEAPGALMAL